MNEVKTFDFSTLYTTIPHTEQKSRIKELIECCFSKKNGEQRYQYLVIGRDKSYSVNSHSKSNPKYKQDEIIQMLDILIDNIFAKFGGRVFQQTIDIPMGINCALLFDYLFLHAYEADFLQGLLKIKDENNPIP